jgi:HEAT repeat protein
LSPNDKKQLVDLSARALEDSSAQVRISAGDALAKLGHPRATPYLQQAIAKENDKEVRSQLHTYLLQLQAQKGE